MKPILFSTLMVQAILEGRKIQTRRVVKPQPDPEGDGAGHVPRALGNEDDWGKWYWDTEEGERILKFCPYGFTGDILWVREKWFPTRFDFNELRMKEYIKYAADGNYDPKRDCVGRSWKPSIHMPMWACRIKLKIKSIRVERLQDITEEDVFAEGVRYPVNDGHPIFKLGEDNSALDFMPEGFKLTGGATPITEKDLMFAHWAELWCAVNGRQSWDANPWVWVLEFELTEKPHNF